MSEPQTATGAQDEPGRYEIRLLGRLDRRWAGRFEGMVLTLEDNGQTLLTGRVVDQAALHGLLRQVRDLALPLIAVTRLGPGPAVAPEVPPGGEAGGVGRRSAFD